MLEVGSPATKTTAPVREEDMGDRVDIRPLVAGDYRAVARIFFCAVHEGTRGAYNYEQRLAWGGETIDLDRWKKRLETLTGFVAEMDDKPVGFFTVDPTGYIELAFVLPSATGIGVGRALLREAERWAKDRGAKRLTTEASLVARPFFLKSGWHVVMEERVERRGVILTRCKMHKALG
ncbi:MAG TPA: GNAT family N-acetyltransferase [Roseovarius sp.]|nr:GNAT family N-acetyltransferase [Roseovarius sp.]